MEVIFKDDIFTEEEKVDIFNFLDKVEIEYRKEYKGMYGRIMQVPRGQASFTFSPDIHYNYKVAG